MSVEVLRVGFVMLCILFPVAIFVFIADLLPPAARRLRCWWRGMHTCRLRDLHRTSTTSVAAPCCSCGKMLRGPYGLALPCQWVGKLTDRNLHGVDIDLT